MDVCQPAELWRMGGKNRGRKKNHNYPADWLVVAVNCNIFSIHYVGYCRSFSRTNSAKISEAQPPFWMGEPPHYNHRRWRPRPLAWTGGGGGDRARPRRPPGGAEARASGRSSSCPDPTRKSCPLDRLVWEVIPLCEAVPVLVVLQADNHDPSLNKLLQGINYVKDYSFWE